MPSSSRQQSGNARTSESRIAKALAHPLRARILQRLGERVAISGAANATELKYLDVFATQLDILHFKRAS